MDKKQGLDFLYSSCFGRYFKKDNITDVTFNGIDVFYVDNNLGRIKSDLRFSQEDARGFIRQLANIAEKQFSIASPNLDITIGKFRINAMHQSLGRADDEQVITFSIRIASEKIRIYEDDDFLTSEIKELFDVLMISHQSVVIGGLPGTGKTELQKYLLTRLPKDQRVIVVDNVSELETVRDYTDYDLTMWQYNENNNNASLPMLIKAALRNMPDWLILAEGRGKEMLDILNSAVTGLPIVTTLHSFDAHSIPIRMARLVMQNEENNRYEDILSDIKYHFRYYVYLKKDKEPSGKVKRYIASIMHLDPTGKETLIYSDDLEKKRYGKIDRDSLMLLKIKRNQTAFIKYFIGEKHE